MITERLYRRTFLLLRGSAKLVLLVAVVAWLNSGCTEKADSQVNGEDVQPVASESRLADGDTGTTDFVPVDSPAPAGSRTPDIQTLPDGGILLSWTEPTDAGHALRFSVLQAESWSEPRTIAEGDNWFVNWADFPSVVPLGGDRMAAHFLAKTSEATYSYAVFITQSDDGGQTWTTPVSPHTDDTATEHGFVSMLPSRIAGSESEESAIFAVWLDGRNTSAGEGHGGGGHGGGGAMTLRTATMDASGLLHHEAELDGRTCDCCQTSAAATVAGMLVVYRDRSEDEIRDISAVRFKDGVWSKPEPIHEDGWQIAGCPVNGPSAASDGSRTAVAWFTAADTVRAVKLALSDDGGDTFGEPIRIDGGTPIGRVHTLIRDDGSVLVSWIEQVGSQAEIQIRLVDEEGEADPPIKVASVTGDRLNGFPRIAGSGSEVYVTWTAASDPPTVHVAMATLN